MWSFWWERARGRRDTPRKLGNLLHGRGLHGSHKDEFFSFINHLVVRAHWNGLVHCQFRQEGPKPDFYELAQFITNCDMVHAHSYATEMLKHQNAFTLEKLCSKDVPVLSAIEFLLHTGFESSVFLYAFVTLRSRS